MSNNPSTEKQQKTFSEFSTGIVRLNLKKNKTNALFSTNKDDNTPFESDLANLLEQMKTQNQEIKNIGTATAQIPTQNEPTINFAPVTEPLINPHSSELMNNILSTHNDPDSHPKQSLDFNFNIVNKDTFNSNLSSFANSIQKDPLLISTINNTQDVKLKPSIIKEIKDIEELSIDSKNIDNKPLIQSKDPFEINTSQPFNAVNSNQSIKQSTNYLINPKTSSNMGFIVEMDSEQFDKNQSVKETKNLIDTIPIAESHRENINFDDNDIVVSANDSKKESEEREERERDRLLKEEEERLERERKEKEEKEKKELERIKKERLEKEKKEREEKERRAKERREKREKERLEKEKREKEEKEKEEKEKKEKLKKEREAKRKKEEEEKKKKEEIDNKPKILKSKKKKIVKEEEKKEEEKKDNDSIKEIGDGELDVVEIEDFDFEEPVPKKEDKSTKKKEVKSPKDPEPLKESKDLKTKKSKKKPKEESKEQPSNRNSKIEQMPSQTHRNHEDLHIQNIKKRIDQIDPKYKSVIPDIHKIFDNIMAFDVDHPDLSDIDEYPHLSSFDRKDPDLHQIIPEFKEKLFAQESARLILKRRKDFLMRSFFEKKIQEYRDLFECSRKIKVQHPIVAKKIYEQYKDNLFKGLKEIDEEEIFSDENIDDISPLPIGEIENFETFVYKYSTHENPKLMANGITLFSYWRESYLDGNSYYRVVMFVLIENFIITSNVIELQKIACELSQDEFKDIFTAKLIDTDIVLNIFKLIISYIEEGNNKEAYDLFLKSYTLKSKSFDYALIAYLRKLSYNMGKELYEIYENDYKGQKEKIKELKPNIEAINIFNTEPDFYVICLLPYLFEINMNLFWVDGNFEIQKDGSVNFIDSDRKDIPLITIGFFFSGFFALYSNNNKEEYEKVVDTSNIKITQLTYKSSELKECEVCKKKTPYIIFLKQKFTACSVCLNDHIQKIIAKRAKALYLSCFIGVEYCTRPIHLKDNFYIGECDYIEIYESDNLINAIYNWIISSCFACNQKFDIKELKTMKCLCRYCPNCLSSKIKTSTKELKVLNRYELTTFPRELCECGKEFDSQEAIQLLGEDISEESVKAAERMIDYVQTLCMLCCKEVAKVTREGDKRTVSQVEKYKVVRIQQENGNNKGIEYSDVPHVICLSCYEKEKENENINKAKEKKKKVMVIEDKKLVMTCKICRKKHNIINDVKEDGKCCGGGCIIF